MNRDIAKTAATEKNTPFRLPSDPNAALRVLLKTIDRMTAILTHENEALKAANTRAYLALQDDKIRVALDYRDAAEQLMARKDALAEKADPRLRTEIEAKRKDFETLRQENMSALSSMSRSVERLHGRIMNAARKQAASRNATYGAGGRMEEQTRRSVSIGVSENA